MAKSGEFWAQFRLKKSVLRPDVASAEDVARAPGAEGRDEVAKVKPGSCRERHAASLRE